jgi:hypothetical protein
LVLRHGRKRSVVGEKGENVLLGSFEAVLSKRNEGTKNEKIASPEDPFRVIGSPSNRKSNTEVIRLPGRQSRTGPHHCPSGGTSGTEEAPAAGRMRNGGVHAAVEAVRNRESDRSNAVAEPPLYTNASVHPIEIPTHVVVSI